MSISSQAKRLKDTAIAAGVPKAFVHVRTETYRRNDNGYKFNEYGLAWGFLDCKQDDLNRYAEKMESFPEDLVVTRHHLPDGKLISVHFEEKVN